MFGVIHDLAAPPLEIAHRVGDHVQVFVEGRAEDVFDVKVGGLAEDGDSGGLSVDEQLNLGVCLDRGVGAAGGAKGGHPGMLEGNVPYPVEIVHVLGVRAGPAALDVVDAKFIEALRNLQFVFDGQGDAFVLCAVAEGGVIDKDAHGILSLSGSRAVLAAATPKPWRGDSLCHP